MNSSTSSSDSLRAAAPGLHRPLMCLAWVASAALALWVTGIGLAAATFRLDYSEPKLRESLGFQGKRLDVAFFGNSLTLEGVSPVEVDAALGTHSYNFALGGASVLESEIQLRKFLEDNPPPRLVALGVYIDADRRYTGISPTLYQELSSALRSLYWQKAGELQNEAFDKSFVLFNHLDAYRYRSSVDLVIKWLLTREDTSPRFASGQAQVEFSRPPGDGAVPHPSQFPLGELRSFLSFCQQGSMKAVVFEPPVSPADPARTLNRAEVVAAVSKVVADFPNAAFQSFAQTGAEVPEQEWVNLNHLNARGARRFSQRLAASLRPLLR